MPPPSRAIRTPRIFPRIFCAFLRDSGTPIFQAPKRRRKNLRKMGAKMGATMGTKICAPKVCAKMGVKICAPKMGAKMGAKICAPKICAKNRFEHSICLEDGNQKKTQKNLRQTCAKRQPQHLFVPFFLFWPCVLLLGVFLGVSFWARCVFGILLELPRPLFLGREAARVFLGFFSLVCVSPFVLFCGFTRFTRRPSQWLDLRQARGARRPAPRPSEGQGEPL